MDKRKYYALWDLDCFRYLETGINSRSKKKLKEAFIGYVNGADGKESITETLDNLCGIYNFEICEQSTPFPEETDPEQAVN